MDDFLQQFLIESRDFVEQATDDLLALENTPEDRERFDSAFRAFHTLKGGAGIVEFGAMEAAVHAVESVLAAARGSAQPISTLDVSDCLICLDQVRAWLDDIERTGQLPDAADAAAAAEAIVARLASAANESPPPPGSREAAASEWVHALLGKLSAAGRARTAIRYRPAADCFYRDVDPVARIQALPGLIAVDIAPVMAWQPLEGHDPFSCNLEITALTDTARDAVVTALGDQMAQCEIETLDNPANPAARHPLWPQALELLEAQLLLLTEVGGEHAAGRTASAAVVATHVLRFIGAAAAADRVAAIASASIEESTPRRLRQAIEAAMQGSRVADTALAPPAGDQDNRAQTLRVDAARVDALVRLTGELTVASNAIGHSVRLADGESPAFAASLKNRHAALARLIRQLQRSVLAMRVLPLRIAFQRFPRLVREMAAELGKPASLVIEGEETEADKTIVEILVEPLLHVLRNAMDHGVEDAATRVAAGKPPVATIRLSASRQAEHVVLEISDDGAGIDIGRVRAVAQARNAASDEVLGAMSDAEVIDLIFAPGFSTAATVTDLSGRGVGMDAVRTAVKRLGGQVEASSVAGQGTTVRFILPFSVMLARVLTVEAGGQMFGIPFDAIVETVRVPGDAIFAVGAAHAIVLKERTVPLVDLAQVLDPGSIGHRGDDAILVIADVNGDPGALQVDRIGEPMEVMLKPFEGLLAGIPGLAGSTLLGDGSVLLVLDLAGLLQ